MHREATESRRRCRNVTMLLNRLLLYTIEQDNYVTRGHLKLDWSFRLNQVLISIFCLCAFFNESCSFFVLPFRLCAMRSLIFFCIMLGHSTKWMKMLVNKTVIDMLYKPNMKQSRRMSRIPVKYHTLIWKKHRKQAVEHRWWEINGKNLAHFPL